MLSFCIRFCLFKSCADRVRKIIQFKDVNNYYVVPGVISTMEESSPLYFLHIENFADNLFFMHFQDIEAYRPVLRYRKRIRLQTRLVKILSLSMVLELRF